MFKPRFFLLDASANFEIELVRYDTSSFTTPARTTTLKLGDMFYFQLKLKNPRADIGMYPQQCYATKKDFTGRYHLIKDRYVENCFDLMYEAVRNLDSF